jgi:COP9 signalosome complex subunit 3
LEGETLSFIDEKPQFRPEDIEKALATAQLECRKLAQIDQQVGRSREFLQKALKERETGGGAGGGWGPQDEAEMAMWQDEMAAAAAYV